MATSALLINPCKATFVPRLKFMKARTHRGAESRRNKVSDKKEEEGRKERQTEKEGNKNDP